MGFLCEGTRVATYNIFKVNATTDIGIINPDQFTNRLPIYLLYGNTTKEQVGYAVAGHYDHMDQPTSVRVSSLLMYATATQSYNFSQDWKITTIDYPVANGGNNFSARVNTPSPAGIANVRAQFNAGNWYVLQFVTHGVIDAHYLVGDTRVASHATSDLPTSNTFFVPTVDDAHTGLIPVYISGLNMAVFTTSEVRSDASANTRELQSDLHPSFGCDDALEFPPPPSEDGLADDDGEFEDPEDPEEDEDEELELGPDDEYSDPPMSRLVVRPEAQQLYEQLRANFPEREARLAVNQLNPSGEYIEFTEMYHNALVDGLSPRAARAFALGL